jgi:hypothetical protein
VIREIAADPSPALRYQSSEESRAIAAQKVVDTTGRSILPGPGECFIPDESTARIHTGVSRGAAVRRNTP